MEPADLLNLLTVEERAAQVQPVTLLRAILVELRWIRQDQQAILVKAAATASATAAMEREIGRGRQY